MWKLLTTSLGSLGANVGGQIVPEVVQIDDSGFVVRRAEELPDGNLHRSFMEEVFYETLLLRLPFFVSYPSLHRDFGNGAQPEQTHI